MKRLQNRIAESRFALPVTAVYATAAWLAGGLISSDSYIEFAVFAVSAYLMAELNNRHALIRMYSRMVSCSFLVLATLAASAAGGTSWAAGTADVWIVQLCFIVAYLFLFSSYQDKRAQGKMFYAFMAIGVASTLFVQALFFVPLLWVLTATNLMAFSSRNLWASIIGLTVPYWFYGGYCALTGNIGYLTAHFAPDAWLKPLFITGGADAATIATTAFIATVTVIGAVHFIRNSYKDKIRTRMLYEMLITVTAFCLAFMLLQPGHLPMLMGILIIHSSILAGHFFALTSTRLTNITFCVLATAAVALTVVNFIS